MQAMRAHANNMDILTPFLLKKFTHFLNKNHHKKRANKAV